MYKTRLVCYCIIVNAGALILQTGSLHLSGKYYDLVPAPEAESKRALDNELFGTSHNLIEIEVPKERIFGSSDVPDVSDVMPTEGRYY